jgi:hypothetical protein
MTTTIGTQMRPYVVEDTSTQEKEATPCDFFRFWGSGPKALSNEKCVNEAKYSGVCGTGCCTANSCEECLDAFGKVYGNPKKHSDFMPYMFHRIQMLHPVVAWFKR